MAHDIRDNETILDYKILEENAIDTMDCAVRDIIAALEKIKRFEFHRQTTLVENTDGYRDAAELCDAARQYKAGVCTLMALRSIRDGNARIVNIPSRVEIEGKVFWKEKEL